MYLVSTQTSQPMGTEVGRGLGVSWGGKGGWGMEYRNLLEGSESLEDMLQRGAIT